MLEEVAGKPSLLTVVRAHTLTFLSWIQPRRPIRTNRPKDARGLGTNQVRLVSREKVVLGGLAITAVSFPVPIDEGTGCTLTTWWQNRGGIHPPTLVENNMVCSTCLCDHY